MLINLSNHPSADWSCQQRQDATRIYGQVVDLPFPPVDPLATKEEITHLAESYFKQVQTVASPREAAVHIMGELNLCYMLVDMLKCAGYTCVASTSERKVEDNGNGEKIVKFDFVQFREY